MADHEYQLQQRPTDAMKSHLPEKGPSKSKILTVVALLPVGGVLLLLSGLTFAGTLFGLAVTTPLFVIFSPVLVPAALVVALSVAGFLTSGAFRITALSSLTWILNYFKGMRGSVVPEKLDYAKRRVQETAGQMGQRAKEVGQKAQETARG